MSFDMSSVRTSYVSAGQSSYMYGVSAKTAFDSPFEQGYGAMKEYPGRSRTVEVPAGKKMDVVYQYRSMEGWQGDIPVSMTYLVAQRAYTDTKLMYQYSGRYSRGNLWVA